MSDPEKLYQLAVQVGLFAPPAILLLRLLWGARGPVAAFLAGLVPKGRTAPSGAPDIAAAFDALQTIKRWGQGRPAAYQTGVRMIEDNWLRSEGPPNETV